MENQSITLNWQLSTLLKKHDITVYQLRKVMLANGVNISKTTAYRWSHEMPETLSVTHLCGVINALREITGKPIDTNDLLKTSSTSE